MRPASQFFEIPDELRDAVEKAFGTVDAFKVKFSQLAYDHFGSGWVWLVVVSAVCVRVRARGGERDY